MSQTPDGLTELQAEVRQKWLSNKQAAAFAGKTGPTAEKKLREFVHSWNCRNPQEPVLCLRGVTEFYSLANALEKSALPKDQRAPRRTERARKAKAMAKLQQGKAGRP